MSLIIITLATGAAALISNSSLIEVNLSDNKLGLEGTCHLKIQQ